MPTQANDPTSPTWGNWSGNLVHKPPANGENYYFRPANLGDLKAVLAGAKAKGVTVRVSGQRHSQAPLVADDNRGTASPALTTYLVDMSCYADLGSGQDQIVLGPGPNQVTVNPGVKEDALDAFLTNNQLMLDAVTAGGFFSIGGMTAVDVHGGTVAAPIFAEAVASFTILGADGNLTTIDGKSKDADGNSLLSFARVSLGMLGVVTSLTLNVLPRPWANTLQGSSERFMAKTKTDFIAKYKERLTGPAKHDRMECFFTPYAAPWGVNNHLVLWWNVVENPRPPVSKTAPTPQSACALSNSNQFGAGLINIGQWGVDIIRGSQTTDPYYLPPAGPAEIAAYALLEIENQVAAANNEFSDLWLAKSSQVVFMSYFIEMPNLDDAGLGKAWDGLAVIDNYVREDGKFHIAAPVEFRFVKGGDSALSGTFTKNPNAYFVNLDLIAWVEQTPSAQYPAVMLKFFSTVERKWVSLGGLPHNGKMYGFYDPADSSPNSYTPPFNKNFLKFITNQRRVARQAPVDAFKKFRSARDPGGLFYTQYLRDLLE
jgi:hypothetical protein